MPFAEILGQGRAVAQVRGAWLAGRMPQAYCFTGPEGVGKRTTALALAQALNCLAPAPGAARSTVGDACGSCVPCRKIAAGHHPDVTIVQPLDKSVIGIDQIRELTARAGLRPYEGRAKVWLLDPADLMQEPAANALLKTLEESVGAALFVLITATPSALLPTIRSRCQSVRFEPLGETDLREILLRHGRSPEEVGVAAALAGGSAARALALDVEHARQLRERTVSGAWGALTSVPAILTEAERLGKERAPFEAALEILVAFTRDLAVTRLGRDAVPLVTAEGGPEVRRLAARVPPGAILHVYEAQVAAQRALARYANPRLVAERMLLTMRAAVGAIGAGRGDAHDLRDAR